MTDPVCRGSAPAALSVLDSAMTGTGRTAAEALAGSIGLARLAGRRGFTRYWTNEHHAMPGVSASSPPVLLARLTAETSRLRLGAGGIMLPNHPPLVVAEQFGMLEALAPGRIDLGLGRAPGTDHATAGTLAHAMLRMFQRKSYLLPSPEEVDAYTYDTQERRTVDSWLDHVPHGTPEQVTAHLDQVQRDSGADELMIGGVGHSVRARLRSIELIADAYGMPDSPH